jgi:molybdate transport system substrate-binding protein
MMALVTFGRARRGVPRRLMLATAVAALAAAPAAGQEAPVGLQVLSSGLSTTAGLGSLTDAYGAQSGVKTAVVGAGMPVIVKAAQTGTPPTDVAILPVAEMDELETAGGVRAGTRARLGRVGVGLALPKGAAKPDITTPQKAYAFLKSAGRVAYTDPKGGSAQATLIAAMLKRPQAQGINAIPFIGRPGGAQAAGAVARGEADVGLQPVGETLFYRPELVAVGPLPDAMGLWVDLDIAVNARSPRPEEARKLEAFLRSPQAAAVWRARGLQTAR